MSVNCLYCAKECNCVNPVTTQKDLRNRIEAKIRNLELNIKYDVYPFPESETKNRHAELENNKIRLENLERID